MARYYFDVHSDSIISRDEFGDVLPTIEDAEQQALELLLATASGDWEKTVGAAMSCRVRDEQGKIVYEARIVIQEKRFLIVGEP